MDTRREKIKIKGVAMPSVSGGGARVRCHRHRGRGTHAGMFASYLGWSRPVHRGGCYEESLSEVVAVVARFKFSLSLEGCSQRRGMRVSTELLLAEESVQTGGAVSGSR